jgi:uncharacterized delta-60 repeat protein
VTSGARAARRSRSLDSVQQGEAVTLDFKFASVKCGGIFHRCGGRNKCGLFGVTRLKPDGSLGPTFGTQGIVATPLIDDSQYPVLNQCTALALAIDPMGCILLGGGLGYAVDVPEETALLRYRPDGTLDKSFGTAAALMRSNPGGAIDSIALQTDGKIVLGGKGGWSVARVTDKGLDTTFGTNGISNFDVGYATSVALQPDGKIVAGIAADLYRLTGK